MLKNKKFSDLLTELTEVWILWMKFNTLCKNEDAPIKKRKEAAETCEELIDKRYVLIDQLDTFFPSSR